MAEWRNMVTAPCCVKTLYFSLWKNSLKFKMLWFFESRHYHLLESIAKIAHFYILTLPGGGGGGGGGVTLAKKIPQKSLFQKLWGENGHDAIDIGASDQNLLAFNREKKFKIKQKCGTRLQKISSRARFFLQLWSKFPLFFIFLA